MTLCKSWIMFDVQCPPDPIVFEDLLDNFALSDKDNIDIICDQYNSFVNCTESGTECFNYDDFGTALNLKNESAALYAYMMYKLQYVCSNGLSCKYIIN